MILSFRHKGLELYAKKGDRSKLPQTLVRKIKLVLTRLDAISEAEEMNQPGYSFHSLKGDLKGFYAVKVSGNWRVIFKVVAENVLDVDLIDYH
jgi:proteic killer suppression protein